MAELIAGLALFISILVFIVNYRNQVERRHGEITKLRSDLIQRSSIARRSMMSTKIHLETARLELRRTNESEDKYNSIEKVPILIEKGQKSITAVDKILGAFNEFNTMKKNKGKVLMVFQSTEHNVRDLENLSSELEKDVLDLLISIRAKQKNTDDQRDRQLDKTQPVNSADPKSRSAG